MFTRRLAKMRRKTVSVFSLSYSSPEHKMTYSAATAAMIAAKAPPMLAAPNAAAPLDGEAEVEAEAEVLVEAPVAVAVERVVEIAADDGEVRIAVELE
jgi:hypothetical protein